MSNYTCKNCGKELKEDEYNINSDEFYTYKGLCKECYNSKFSKNSNVNSTSSTIKAIGFIQIILGVIALFVLLGNQFYTGLIIFITAFVTGILEVGFAEVIQLLEDIKNK